MLVEVVEQLKKIEHETVSPNPAWVAKNRELLLSQIKNTVPETVSLKRREKMWQGLSIFLPKPLVFVIRPLTACLVIAVGAVLVYTGTVQASYQALPGQWLYPAKLATEEVQSTIVSFLDNQTAQSQFQLSLAVRRADETQQLLQGNSPEKTAEATAAVAALKQNLTAADDHLAAVGSAKVSPGVAATVAANTQEIKDVMIAAMIDSTGAPDASFTQGVQQVFPLIQTIQTTVGAAVSDTTSGIIATGTVGLAITPPTPSSTSSTIASDATVSSTIASSSTITMQSLLTTVTGTADTGATNTTATIVLGAPTTSLTIITDTTTDKK